MINQNFWKKVAAQWSVIDQTVIPDIRHISDDLGVDDIDEITDELEDILADIEI